MRTKIIALAVMMLAAFVILFWPTYDGQTPLKDARLERFCWFYRQTWLKDYSLKKSALAGEDADKILRRRDVRKRLAVLGYRDMPPGWSPEQPHWDARIETFCRSLAETHRPLQAAKSAGLPSSKKAVQALLNWGDVARRCNALGANAQLDDWTPPRGAE